MKVRYTISEEESDDKYATQCEICGTFAGIPCDCWE